MSSCPLSSLVLDLAAPRTFPPAIVKVCSINIITSTDKLHLLVFYIRSLHITLFFLSPTVTSVSQMPTCLSCAWHNYVFITVARGLYKDNNLTYSFSVPAGPVDSMQSKFFYCVILPLLTLCSTNQRFLISTKTN